MNVISYVEWGSGGNGNLCEGGKKMCEGKRGLEGEREREKKEVKWMFGQMKRDGWEQTAWAKEAGEAAQLGLIRQFSPLCPALHTSFSVPPIPSSCPLLKL